MPGPLCEYRLTQRFIVPITNHYFFKRHALGFEQYYLASFLHERPGVEVLYVLQLHSLFLGKGYFCDSHSRLPSAMQKPCHHMYIKF